MGANGFGSRRWGLQRDRFAWGRVHGRTRTTGSRRSVRRALRDGLAVRRPTTSGWTPRPASTSWSSSPRRTTPRGRRKAGGAGRPKVSSSRSRPTSRPRMGSRPSSCGSGSRATRRSTTTAPTSTTSFFVASPRRTERTTTTRSRERRWRRPMSRASRRSCSHRHPTASVGQVRAAVLGAVDPVGGLSGVVATGGRLNACRALVGCVPSSRRRLRRRSTPLRRRSARLRRLYHLLRRPRRRLSRVPR